MTLMANQMSLSDEDEKIASLFQPDTLLSAQYFETLRRRVLDPEKRLMLAIIEEAIGSYQKYLCAQDRRGRTLFGDAEKWIWDEDSNWVFSFENICEALGLTPTYVRCGLLRWKEKELSRRRSTRMIQNPMPGLRLERDGRRRAWVRKISQGKKIA